MRKIILLKAWNKLEARQTIFTATRLVHERPETKINSKFLVSYCLMKYQNIIGKTRDNYNPVQNIWQKVKGYNKIGQGFKNIISNVRCFLTAIVNV